VQSDLEFVKVRTLLVALVSTLPVVLKQSDWALMNGTLNEKVSIHSEFYGWMMKFGESRRSA